MSDGGGSEGDLFRLWLEGARAFVSASPDSGLGWRQVETLYAAWTSFAEAFAEADQTRRGSPGTGPFDPAGWLRSEGDGGAADLWRWLEGPELADLWREERRTIRETREWMAYLAALEQFRNVAARGWLQAFRVFIETLGKRAEKARAEGGEEPGLSEMTALWREIADGEMARAHRSPDFLAAQSALLAAQMAVRAALRRRVERMAQFLGLPTRAELDDLHRTVHALRRELADVGAAGGRARADLGDEP